MSPKSVAKTKVSTDLSWQKEIFPDYNEAAILELLSLLGINTETLLLHLVILQNYDLEEGVFASRLRARFQERKCNQTVPEDVEAILHHLGIDSLSSKAWNYILSKCSLEDNHLDIIDWAVLYMQDLIRYSLFPQKVFGKFPYQESTTGEWFKQEGEEEEGKTYGEVNILNIEKIQKDAPYPLLDGKCFPEGIEEEGHELFYHGTNHKSAESILKEGIKLELKTSKKKIKYKDFSYLKGFYLNNNYEKARSWAFRTKSEKRAAVLIFKIPKQVLDVFREASINLIDNEDKWKWIVSSFRLGRPSKEFKKEMKGVSFIEGPMASVVVVRGFLKIKGPIEGSYQMCLHSDALAEQFDVHLHSIVFFE